MNRIISTDFDYADPLLDGKIKNEALQATSQEFKIGLDMDERICYLVEKHVDAKRYLVTIDEKNYDNLSDASKKTLEYQGGKMSDYELTAMEKDDDFLNILKVRKHDDKGKNEDQEIPDIETFIPLIRKYL